ncbi:hypothetical protein KSP39_PZI023829 [Platanthera zijinensis]|uniref:Uncharacterized protein n=1 Tax=Platanthera zijinensis TaxID=2320716 RepID=A0AAP0AS75_9ASPA
MVNLLDTVDLIPPGRSTVGECLPRSSTCAELSQADVMKDAASIGWQACPIVSILTVSNESAATSAAVGIAPISTSSTSGRSKKRRSRNVALLINACQ